VAVKTAKEVRNRLRNRFGKSSEAVPMPEHIVLFEVPVDGVQRLGGVTPDGKEWTHERTIRRRIDAVAVGTWKKTDHLIHGFEIKVSRADLLSELKDPEKAAPAINMVDRWWLVLGDAKILKDTDPVPEGWGIMAAHGRGLKVLREAAPTGGSPDPRFVAALLQSAIGGRGSVTRSLGYWEGVNRGVASGKLSGRSEGYRDGYRAGIQSEREHWERITNPTGALS
jgi:hypothetical protein